MPIGFSDRAIRAEFQSLYKRVKGEFQNTVDLKNFKDGVACPNFVNVKEKMDALKEETIDLVAEEEGTQQLLRFIKSIPKIKF